MLRGFSAKWPQPSPKYVLVVLRGGGGGGGCWDRWSLGAGWGELGLHNVLQLQANLPVFHAILTIQGSSTLCREGGRLCMRWGRTN